MARHNKEMDQLIAVVEAVPGWSASMTRNNHFKFLGPEGALIHTGGTPSDWRATRNLKAALVRSGFPREAFTGQAVR